MKKVFVCKTFVAMSKGSGIRCKTTLPYIRSTHYVIMSTYINIQYSCV